MFFNILYNITIYPIEFIIDTLFYLFSNVFNSSYPVSLFLLSLSINFLSLPLYNIAEAWQSKERAIQDKMRPMIDNIKSVYKGDQRYLLIRTCQRINNYKTIYAFRGTLGLLIQIPFFMAAYNFVHNLSGLNGVPFFIIKDLSKPDALINIGTFNINVLPFIMTVFSLLAGAVYSKKLKFKESLPLYIVSLIFLVLLYNSPSGLLFYWTINCLFSLMKNIVIEYKLKLREVFIFIKSNLLKIYNIFVIILAVVFIALFILGNIERKGYIGTLREKVDYLEYSFTFKYYTTIFKHSDIYGLSVNENKLPDNIIKIEFEKVGSPFGIVKFNEMPEKDYVDNFYYTLYLKPIIVILFIIIFIISIFINLLKNKIYFLYLELINNSKKRIQCLIEKNDYKTFNNSRNILIILSCLIVTILSGLFIPTSLIVTSFQEFNNIYGLIINTFSTSIGMFLFYPLMLYMLFSDKIKNTLSVIFIVIIPIVFINIFIFVGNYGNITSNFIFDNAELLKNNSFYTVLNILLILFSLFIFLILLYNKKYNFIKNIYFIVCLSLIFISLFNFIKINSYISKNNTTLSYKSDESNIFKLSKKGHNIFVFILDAAISSYWSDAFERFPEYKYKFDGFTFFNNIVSLGYATTTVANVHGGYEYSAYELSTNGSFSIKDKHNEALLMIPVSLKQYGYESSLLSPAYSGFDPYHYDLSIFNNYGNAISAHAGISASNIYKYLNISDELYRLDNIINYDRAIRFSIFRMLPSFFRYAFYQNGKWSIIKKPMLTGSMYNYYGLLAVKDISTIKDSGNYYNILHNTITHRPHEFNTNFLPEIELHNVDPKDLEIYGDEYSVRCFYANVAGMNCIVDFINFLKENNIYDNTKIILVSDHGDRANTPNLKTYGFLNSFNALLMYKDFNSNGVLKIDTNFMTTADVAYLSTKHIPNITNYFTGNIITNDYKKNGVYITRTHWDIDPKYTNRYNFDHFYYIKDDISDFNNLKEFIIDWDRGKTKEIIIKTNN
ncbi:YidC/Oxa1 family membrane protein insertase [Brachyspira alvinipulli]|uniref:YidC/Oxa1 family membrane protein insertase n=1 Tax=Brachyspira alvinipulli TaxID=84379 RepID=UPI00300681D3